MGADGVAVDDDLRRRQHVAQHVHGAAVARRVAGQRVHLGAEGLAAQGRQPQRIAGRRHQALCAVGDGDDRVLLRVEPAGMELQPRASSVTRSRRRVV